MGIFDKIFNREKETSEEQQEEKQPVEEEHEETQEEYVQKDAEGYNICYACKFHIIPEEHGERTFDGKKFHKKCLRNIFKQGNKKAFSN